MSKLSFIAVALAAAIAAGVIAVSPGSGSSHREAPLTALDPTADDTDLYAFTAPDATGALTVVANWIRFEDPAGGPNFYGIDLLHGVGGSAGVGVLLLAAIPSHGEAVAAPARRSSTAICEGHTMRPPRGEHRRRRGHVMTGPAGPRQEGAHKIEPRFAKGDLVKVAGAQNQAEAEFVQSLLLEEGVPSVLRRSRGFDVPDFLAAGPRDVLVPASGAEAARDVLLQADLRPLLPDSGGVDAPVRLLAGLLVALALVAVIAWLGTELLA